MRAALETIQQIEQYLLNEMSAAEKLAFEAEINSNLTLKNQVETQQQLIEGIQRMGLKASAVKARAKYQLRKWMIRIGVLITLISLSSFTYIYLSGEEDCVPCHYESSESNVDRPHQENCCPQIEANSSTVETTATSIEEFTEEEYFPESDVDSVASDDKTEVETIESNEDVLENQVSNKIITDEILVPSVEFNANGNSTIKNYALKVKPNEMADPAFPGGDQALIEWLRENMVYPSGNNAKLTGTVYVDFIVSKTGKVQNTSVERGVHPILDAAALATVKKMPNWVPAELNGEKVSVKYTIPIKYITRVL